jgi:hypothetical protein
MTIFMITREHEYQGGNGSWYEDYVDEDFGYFVTKEEAELKLHELRAREAVSHRDQWERMVHKNWELRKAQHDRVQANNAILIEHGGTPERLPHVYPEPVYKEWNVSMSDYNIITVEPALGSASSPEGEAR